jgi:hypothetical protein
LIFPLEWHSPASAAKASTGISTPLFNFTVGMSAAAAKLSAKERRKSAMIDARKPYPKEKGRFVGDLRENLQ